MSTVQIRTQVYLDLDELAAWIQRDDPSVALRLIDQAEAAFESLATMPGIGSPVSVRNPRLDGLRCFPVRGFPNHLIFYIPLNDGIEVIRVLHGARDLPSILDKE